MRKTIFCYDFQNKTKQNPKVGEKTYNIKTKYSENLGMSK